MLVLVIGATAFVWFRNNGGNSEGANNSVATNVNLAPSFRLVRDSFNEYVNYLSSGTTSLQSADLDNLKYNDDLQIVEMLDAGKAKQRAYYAELELQFSEFADALNTAFPDLDTGDVISSNHNYLNYLKLYAESDLKRSEVPDSSLGDGDGLSAEDYGDLEFDVMCLVGNAKNIDTILKREGA